MNTYKANSHATILGEGEDSAARTSEAAPPSHPLGPPSASPSLDFHGNHSYFTLYFQHLSILLASYTSGPL